MNQLHTKGQRIIWLVTIGCHPVICGLVGTRVYYYISGERAHILKDEIKNIECAFNALM